MPAAEKEDQASGNGVSAWSTYTEQVAADILNHDGLAAIWQLHLSAAKAHHEGKRQAAQYLQDIADAADRVWLRRSEDDHTGPQQQG